MIATMEFHPEFIEIYKRPPQGPLKFEILPDHNNIKHHIETFFIPHTEVGLVTVNGTPVDFSYRPKISDHIQIYPLKGPVDVTVATPLRPLAFYANHFIVDECVASLTPKLRMLGCDVKYESHLDDKDIAQISSIEKRTVLTRDRGLLQRKEVMWGRLIRNTDPQLQIKEVVRFFGLTPLADAFMRCLVCNGFLEAVSKEKVWEELEPKTRLYYHAFSQCSSCGKIYWEGSHYNKMVENLDGILGK